MSVFGDDWFALKAEAFATLLRTPIFLISQTVVVAGWILVNIWGDPFDIYPFILLNLVQPAGRLCRAADSAGADPAGDRGPG